MEEWNKDDICLDNKEISNKIILSKLIEIKEQKKNIVIKNIDNISRKFIHEIVQKEKMHSRAINRRKENIADLEISYEIFKYKDIKKPYWRKTWRGECSECSTELTIQEAIFNWRWSSPYCEECVENDEDLNGLKWEKI
jgi:LPS O-antigen subunit length determinant protein (WzzB/FepE family)